MNEYKCLDCYFVGQLDEHGFCSRCGSRSVILRGLIRTPLETTNPLAREPQPGADPQASPE